MSNLDPIKYQERQKPYHKIRKHRQNEPKNNTSSKEVQREIEINLVAGESETHIKQPEK